MNVELLANGHLEFFQASKNAAANALVGNFGKPAFHQCVVTSIRLWFPTSINTACLRARYAEMCQTLFIREVHCSTTASCSSRTECPRRHPGRL